MKATAARDDEHGLNLREAADDAPTQQFVGAAVGDRCASCGTALAADQMYCLNCGERRGRPRFALGTPPTPMAAAPAVAARTPRRQRLSSSTALVAGVGTLLLAMGVGVLIGHTDTGSNQRASNPAPQIITVGGGGASSSGTAATTTSPKSSATAKAKASTKKIKTAKAKSNPITPKEAAKAQAAASKVLGSSKNLPPPTVTQGQAGHGPGYTNGHFTGTFFGQ